MGDHFVSMLFDSADLPENDIYASLETFPFVVSSSFLLKLPLSCSPIPNQTLDL